MKNKQTATRSTTSKASNRFSAEERAAMRERARETKAGAADPEEEVLAKIAEMNDADRAMAERLHALIKGMGLAAKTWYGQPAYAKDGNTICFFQPAQKFKTRYATLGFSDKAKLDEGNIWPTYYALNKLTDADEERIRALVKRAVS